jgi:hypothetical protein
VYKDAPGCRPPPRVRDSRFGVYVESPGFRPPAREKNASSCIRWNQAVALASVVEQVEPVSETPGLCAQYKAIRQQLSSFASNCNLRPYIKDGDAPGLALAEELARRLGKERCYKVSWPDGSKDANDVLQNLGDATLRGCIDNAEGFPLRGLFRFSDFEVGRCRLNQT